MAERIEAESLRAAWRALAGGGGDGWRTILLGHCAGVSVLAGRRMPDDQESVLLGFHGVRLPPAGQLPHGRGFTVVRAELGPAGVEQGWIGLCSRGAGELDLFAKMVCDVLVTLADLPPVTPDKAFQVCLARIRAWQEFMHRARDVLSPEAELGLVGELRVLAQLIEEGQDPLSVVESWQGPLDGVQDFRLGAGAIEVKTTAMAAGFPASINGLDQLDDALTRPIFVAAVRVSATDVGDTLAARIGSLRVRLGVGNSARAAFDTRLLHAGYGDAVADQYNRRFMDGDIRYLQVDDQFPRLTKATVPAGVRSARYEIEIESTSTPPVALSAVLHALGVL
ncbi:PD-(D/E)XK motif protein [Ideonella sp.]|uniref:PD-(D/E)XK motif protein n=1 Tax=Ideonella sp. TaxID=1929293 RepID=UPI003BB53681